MIMKLPEKGRPRGVRYKKCALGVDLPSKFIYELKALDENLFPVFHPYQTLWDSIINEDSGELEDPRYQIKYKYGELNFGFVLTDGQGQPTPDGHWHIWRWCEPHGWAHIINVDSKEQGYLNLLVKRLWLQDRFTTKYGNRGYTKMLEEMDLKQRDKTMDDRKDLMNEISKVNSGMLNRAAQNMASGITAPSNPTKEIITSYANQSSKRKIVRPITDKEGGLILPEDW